MTDADYADDQAYEEELERVSKPIASAHVASVIPQIPPEIAKAWSNVMAAIKKLHKGSYNPMGGGYNYASADAFFEALGPLMAAEGLLIIPQQVNWQTQVMNTQNEGRGGGYQKRVVMLVDWDVYLAHSSGSVWTYPLRRTIVADSGSPQKWGGAQTYMIKQFLRALLLIPTGDDPPDKDADKTADADADQPFKAVVSPPRKRVSAPGNVSPPAQEQPTQPEAASTGDTGTVAGPLTLAEAASGFRAALVQTKTPAEAEVLLTTFRATWNLSNQQNANVVDAYNRHLEKLARQQT